MPTDNGQGRLDRYDYRNRFRYFLKGVVPVARDTQGRTKYYVGLYNEFMLNFGAGSRSNIFDQNRAYAALGIRLPRLGNLEIGYLQQTVQKGKRARDRVQPYVPSRAFLDRSIQEGRRLV